MKKPFCAKVLSLLLVGLSVTVFASVTQADVISNVGNVTDFFGNQNSVADAGDALGLLFDEARTGGGDTAASSSFSPARVLAGVAGTNSNWAAGLPTGSAGTISFTGLGFALRNDTTATEASLNIIYLGANGAVGGGDDQVVGSVTDSLQYGSVGEYGWRFDNPIEFNWDGVNNVFRFEITGNDGNLRFKQRPVSESPSGQGGLTLSVGGSFSAVPEPSSAAIVTLIGIGVCFRRRRS